MNRALPRSGIDTLRFPSVPAAPGAAMLAVQYQLAQSEFWPAADLEKLQTLQLEHLIAHARTHSPFWRETLVGGKLSASELSEGAWETLPVLERSQVQALSESLICTAIPADHGDRLSFGTSGSTGRPLVGQWTQLMHFFWGAINLRDHLWHRRDFGSRFAAIRTKVKREVLPGWGPAIESAYATGPACTLPIDVPIVEQLRWLVDTRAKYLLTHASNLRALVLLSRHEGVAPEGLSEVLTFGEMIDADLRSLCRDNWGVLLSDIYSCEEGGYLALECPEAPGTYHVQSETVRLEVLDPQNRPCDAGSIGRVVITPLHNYAMPLLRYALGDYAEVAGICTCGRRLPTLRRVMGRARNLVKLPDGSRHWPSFPAEDWLAIAPVLQFRLVQHALHSIRVEIVAGRPLSAAEKAALAVMLRDHLHYAFEIEFLELPVLQAAANHKFEDFVCEVP